MKKKCLIFILCLSVEHLALSDDRLFAWFAGSSWNQANTPDRVDFIGNSDIFGDIQFSPGEPGHTTGKVGFPHMRQSRFFNPNLCLGSLGRSNHCAALNLPLGNDGSRTRHGITLYWSQNRTLENQDGFDLAIYESGTSSGGPDAFMTRVRSASTNEWSFWHYQAFNHFEKYVSGTRDEGTFVTMLNLDQLDIPQGDRIDAIQIANMMPTDRVNSDLLIAFEGQVFAETQSKARYSIPGHYRFGHAKSFAQGSKYDPDILYVAGLNSLSRKD